MQAVQQAMAQDDKGNWISVGQANVDWRESKAMWCDAGSATQQTWGKEFLVSFLYRCAFFDLADDVRTDLTMVLNRNLTNSPWSGQKATILSATASAGTAVIGNLPFIQGVQVGMSLQLSGAANAANNGTFPISFLLSPTSFVISNPSAVFPDANSGSIAWSLVPTP